MLNFTLLIFSLERLWKFQYSCQSASSTKCKSGNVNSRKKAGMMTKDYLETASNNKKKIHRQSLVNSVTVNLGYGIIKSISNLP